MWRALKILLLSVSPLASLKSFGVGGNTLRWFSKCLDGRKQRVVLEGCCSEWGEVLRGLHQGSLLGPLLFLIYVNDLPDVITKCTVTMYADDVAIYLPAKM